MTPFKDLPEGQTHYQNDGCGEPAHNDTPGWEERFDKLLQFSKCCGATFTTDDNVSYCDRCKKYCLLVTPDYVKAFIMQELARSEKYDEEVQEIILDDVRERALEEAAQVAEKDGDTAVAQAIRKLKHHD